MPYDGNPIKVIAIEWQKNADMIGGLRLVLSNGQKSPGFFSKNLHE
jgi:hypothetical protein